MGRFNRFFIGFFGLCWAILQSSSVSAAQKVNPRGGLVQANQSISQVQQSGTTRVNPLTDLSGATRRATSGAVRSRAATSTRNDGRTATRAATANVSSGRSRMTKARTAVSRSAVTPSVASQARSAKNLGGVARSSVARATAVFNDVTKIGSGYAQCRESYATCMDQMCANANDTYRRCFCSERFETFRDIEDSLDQAMVALRQFEDNSLNVIDKTAAEVDAMYSPTVGEQAIKKDTSAAAKALDSINDLLSGKVSSKSSSGYSTSLGILDLDFTTDLDDIWSGDGVSLFDSNQDISSLEGKELFSAAQRQCTRVSQNMCENTSVFNVAKNAYNILITQDCNTYEKKLNTKKETVAKALREAEKYLREARLEEYRAHNSADVNECLGKVRTAMLKDTACGEDYKHCLDPTGAYIDTNGDVIYGPRLFELENLITLSGDMSDDVFKTGSNSLFEKRLDQYRQYVTSELDTCRGIADFVWTEFKRTALIEIAQAQSAKLDDAKSDCVEIIADCYDETTNTLKNVDKATATITGAIGRYAAADMCKEKVVACASLYKKPNAEVCQFDSNGHLLQDSLTGCGLASLLEYVKVVDSWNITSSCKEAVEEYMLNLCGNEDTEYGYPYLCRERDQNELGDLVHKFVLENCFVDSNRPDNWNGVQNSNPTIASAVNAVLGSVTDGMRAVLADICEDLDGYWVNHNDTDFEQGTRLASFYTEVASTESAINTWGECVVPTEKLMCLWYNNDEETPITSWSDALQQCTFSDAWYIRRCEEIDGYFENNYCYVEPNL